MKEVLTDKQIVVGVRVWFCEREREREMSGEWIGCLVCVLECEQLWCNGNTTAFQAVVASSSLASCWMRGK